MHFDIEFSKDLTLNIRKCPHLLIIGKGDQYSKFAEQLEQQIEFVDTENISSADIWVHRCLTGYSEEEQQMNERYVLLSAFDCNNIEQYNDRFKHENMTSYAMFASPIKDKVNIDALKQILMKGRAVGIYVIMFADSVAEFGDDADLLDMFPVKLVYKVNNAEESILLTGCAGAENLKDNEFMLCELGKQPVVYKS